MNYKEIKYAYRILQNREALTEAPSTYVFAQVMRNLSHKKPGMLSQRYISSYLST